MTGDRHEPRPAPHGAQRALLRKLPHSRRCARAALAQGAAVRRRAHLFVGRGHETSGASSTLQRQCCGAALLLLPPRLRRDAARGSHAAGAHVAWTVHTCWASVGLHTLRSVARPGNAAEPSAASRQRFVSAAAKGATRKQAPIRDKRRTLPCARRICPSPTLAGVRREGHSMTQLRSNSLRTRVLSPNLRLCHTVPMLSSPVKCSARMRRGNNRPRG